MKLTNFIVMNATIVASGVLVGTVVTVGLLTTTLSATKLETSYMFREIPEPSLNIPISESLDETKYEDLPIVQHSYKKIIDGDKEFNNGNYVIYYGSEACTHCMGFLYGDQDISDGTYFPDRDKLSNGTWLKAFESTRLDSEIKDLNIKFLMYEDIPDYELTSKDAVYWTLPWARWPGSDLSKGRVAGEYIRNDKSAKEFRELFQTAQEKFGEKVSGTPTVIVYKEGRPVVFNRDTLPGLTENKQDESLSDNLELKKFIKYYFTRVE